MESSWMLLFKYLRERQLDALLSDSLRNESL